VTRVNRGSQMVGGGRKMLSAKQKQRGEGRMKEGARSSEDTIHIKRSLGGRLSRYQGRSLADKGMKQGEREEETRRT